MTYEEWKEKPEWEKILSSIVPGDYYPEHYPELYNRVKRVNEIAERGDKKLKSTQTIATIVEQWERDIRKGDNHKT